MVEVERQEKKTAAWIGSQWLAAGSSRVEARLGPGGLGGARCSKLQGQGRQLQPLQSTLDLSTKLTWAGLAGLAAQLATASLEVPW